MKEPRDDARTVGDASQVETAAHRLMAQASGLITAGRAPEALELVDCVLASVAQPAAEALLLRAQLLMSLGRPAQAIAAFEAAVSAAPANGRIDLGLAVAHGESGMPEAAAAAARSAIGKGFDNPGSRFVLARALFELDRFDESEAAFRHVIQQDAAHVAAHSSLADLVWMRTGDLDAAMAAIDSVCSAEPRVELAMVKARLLNEAGAPERALAELLPWLEKQPQHVDLHVLAARCALGFDATRALGLIEHALRQAPRNRPAHGLHGDALLATGRADAAAALAGRLLASDTSDAHALALQAAAWRLLGDSRYRSMYDYGRLVRSYRIDVPQGWADLEGYLRDLAGSLHARHDKLQANPPGQSVRSGTQVELRPDAPAADRATASFPQAVDGAIRRYLQSLASDTAGDAFARRNTGRYRFNGLWSVRLRPNGHHANHYHGKGWISSACHIAVPDSAKGSDRGGWLKFGEPGLPTTPALPPEHFVKPEPGLLTLFPSWMWHGTVPFAGAPGDHRLAVAFDLVPD